MKVLYLSFVYVQLFLWVLYLSIWTTPLQLNSYLFNFLLPVRSHVWTAHVQHSELGSFSYPEPTRSSFDSRPRGLWVQEWTQMVRNCECFSSTSLHTVSKQFLTHFIKLYARITVIYLKENQLFTCCRSASVSWIREARSVNTPKYFSNPSNRPVHKRSFFSSITDAIFFQCSSSRLKMWNIHLNVRWADLR